MKAIRGILFALAGAATFGTQAAERELVIFNWSEYLDPEVVAAFEAEHEAEVRIVHYGDDDHRDRLMAETDGENFDLIVVGGSRLDVYRDRGWIRELEQESIPNRRHLDERWVNAFPAAREYGLPYFWGTVGIAYRRDLVSGPITSWMQLYQPASELHGRIVMPNTARDVLAMALKARGHSVNTDDPDAMIEAGRLAMEQKPAVAAYSYVSVGEQSSLVSGSAVAAMVYGGDALNIAEHNSDVVYVLPEEGGAIWCDYFAVSAHTRKPELAHAFLDFINRPEMAARQAEYMYLATPNRAARQLLDPELLSNPVIYPDQDALSQSEFYRPLDPKILRLQSQIFTRIVE